MNRLLVVATVLGLSMLAATPAAATLRSPKLESGCPDGFKYAERAFYSLIVEGCSKEAEPSGAESSRWIYRGVVEVSGLLVEGPGDLVASTKRNSDGNEIGRVQRSSDRAKIVLDPLVAGERRRVVLYTGPVDMRSQSTIPTRFVIDPGFDVQPETAVAVRPSARAAGATTGTSSRGRIDIPVNGGPELLGMRVRETIHDVRARRTTSGSDITGQLELDMTMSLGQLVPAVFRDQTSRVKLTVIDGGRAEIDGLRLKLPEIAVPGIGGFRKLSVRYSESDDLWTGTVRLDLGDLLPELDFELAVRGSDGGVNYIRTEAGNLSIPIGNSGVFIDSVRAAFNLEPLWMSAGAGLRAGPKIAGAALITGDGDFRVDIEPRFKLSAEGRVEVLPVGGSALATGTGGVLLDSAGYLKISADTRYEVALAGVGIGATIGGSGAYATDRNQFNISARANGELLLGFLGTVDVLSAKAVVSSDGWGTCTEIGGFISAGVGQNWSSNVQLFTHCDLSAYRTVVRASGSAAAAGSRTFTVDPGTKRIGLEITGAGPEPKVQLVSPRGRVVAGSLTTGTRVTAGGKATVIAPPGQDRQLFAVKNPEAGTWTVRWRAGGPAVTEVKLARDAQPITATTSVTDRSGDRPGRRRVKVSRIKGLDRGEKVMIGVKTPAGVVPLGTVGGEGLDASFDELEGGEREIVATVVRNGVPLPVRTRTLKRYRDRLSGGAARIERNRNGATLKVRAIAREGEERPDAWQYTFSSQAGVFQTVTAKDGRRVKVTLPNFQKRVRVGVRPIFHGRSLRTGDASARVR